LIQPTKYKPREKPRHRHGNERKLKDKNTEKIREGQAERNKQTTERGGRKRTIFYIRNFKEIVIVFEFICRSLVFFLDISLYN
jgi:hypothetical protein